MRTILRIIAKTGLILVVFSIGIALGIRIMSYESRRDLASQTANQITGQSLFDAINNYRASRGLDLVTLDSNFCNNIVSRYQIMNDPSTIGHAGFEEWAKKELPKGTYVSEIAGPGITAQDLINGWLASPSHRQALEEPKNTVGCTYAADGYGVAELGYY